MWPHSTHMLASQREAASLNCDWDFQPAVKQKACCCCCTASVDKNLNSRTHWQILTWWTQIRRAAAAAVYIVPSRKGLWRRDVALHGSLLKLGPPWPLAEQMSTFRKATRHKKHRKECRLHFCLPARMMDFFPPKTNSSSQTGDWCIKEKKNPKTHMESSCIRVDMNLCFMKGESQRIENLLAWVDTHTHTPSQVSVAKYACWCWH